MTCLAQPATVRGSAEAMDAPSVTRFLPIKREKGKIDFSSQSLPQHQRSSVPLSLPFLFEAGALKPAATMRALTRHLHIILSCMDSFLPAVSLGCYFPTLSFPSCINQDTVRGPYVLDNVNLIVPCEPQPVSGALSSRMIEHRVSQTVVKAAPSLLSLTSRRIGTRLARRPDFRVDKYLESHTK